jgi:chromosome segregation ATPase
MKKITAVVLALGLSVPAQACHLFPVRKEIVTVKETDYAVTAVAIGVFVVNLLAALAGIWYMDYEKHNLITELDTEKRKNHDLERDVNGWRDASYELEDQADEKDEQIEYWKGKHAEVQRQLDEVNTTSIQPLRDKLKENAETITRLNEQLTDLQKQLDAAKAEWQKEYDKNVGAQQEWIRMNRLITQIRTAEENVEAERNELRKKAEGLGHGIKRRQSAQCSITKRRRD